jgi:hypothetical protein
MAQSAVPLVVAVVLSTLSTPAAAQLYSCRTYPQPAVLAQLKAHVAAMRQIEREAADRLIGLDTRPYDWLLGQARAEEAAIAAPALLAAESALKRCRNFIRPVRRDCAAGAAALVRIIEELVSGDATNDTKMTFAQTMPRCERLSGFTPIDTTLRTFK